MGDTALPGLAGDSLTASGGVAFCPGAVGVATIHKSVDICIRRGCISRRRNRERPTRSDICSGAGVSALCPHRIMLAIWAMWRCGDGGDDGGHGAGSPGKCQAVERAPMAAHMEGRRRVVNVYGIVLTFDSLFILFRHIFVMICRRFSANYSAPSFYNPADSKLYVVFKKTNIFGANSPSDCPRVCQVLLPLKGVSGIDKGIKSALILPKKI